MNKFLYILAVAGSLLATGMLYDHFPGGDQRFIMEVVASFLALSVALVAFNLSVQHRNKLTPYLGLSFLAAGIFDLLRILFANGILLPPVAPIDYFNATSGMLGQVTFSLVLSLGMVHAFKGRGIWSVLPHYSALTVLLAGALMATLTQIPLPHAVIITEQGVYWPLELLPCIGYVLFIGAVVKARSAKRALREYLLGQSFLPCILVLLVSQLILWSAPSVQHGTIGVAIALKIIAYLLALIPAIVNLWRYAEYSFQVAGARLVTIFSITLLMLSLLSIVQFNRHEREIKNNDVQVLVKLLQKQHQLNSIEFAIQNYLLFAEQQYLEKLQPLWKLQKDISELLEGRIKQQDLQEINQRFLALQSMSSKILSIAADGEVGHKVFIAEQLLTSVQQLRKYLGRILDEESAGLPASKQRKIASVHDQLVFELALLLSIILIVVGVSRRHYWNQIQPVIKLNEVAQRITSGQRNVDINTDRKDELGALGSSLNAMLKHLQSAMDELEDRVNERTEELGRSERQLRSIMDNVDEAIITANDRGLIKSVNSAACDIFGYEQQEMIGSPIYRLMPADKREPHINAIRQFHEQGVKKVLGMHGRREMALRKDGSTFPIEINVTEVIKEKKRIFIGVLRDITEAQKAENALRESERRLGRFFDASFEGLLFHEHGYIVDANNAALDLLGRHLLDIVGQNLVDFISPEHRDYLQRILDSHSPELWESYIDRGHDSPVPVEIQIRDIAFGDSIKSIAVIRDIADRKHAQQALDRHNQFTSRILDIVGSLVFVLDARGRIVRFNKACEQLTGYTFEQVEGESIWDIMPDMDNAGEIQQLYRHPASNDFPNQRRFDWPTTNGEIRTIDWINSAFINDDGTVEYVIAAGVDVTDRLLVEQVLSNQLETLERKVKERTRELDAIFTLSPDGFVMINEQHQVVYANPAFFEMTGIDPNQVIGNTEQEFCYRVVELCDTPSDRSQRMDSSFFKESSVLTIKRPAEKVLSCTVRDIHDERKTFDGMVLYFRDITHETEVDRMKSEFLSTAAHEFRTPLSSILGFSELLLAGNLTEDKRASVTNIIHRQSIYLKSLLDELLDLARIDARAGRDFYMSVNTPDALVNEVIEETRSLAGEMHTLTIELPDQWPLIAFDEDKMRQVLTNVLSNAYKYSPDGGAVICTAVTREHNQQQQFGIKVQDQGIGMTPEELNRVGERFYRADASGTIPGTGLGMSLVEEIMKLHNGEVEMASEKGKGTTVILWLPVINDQATAKAI